MGCTTLNIENMEAFVYVIHYGSFNKAAEALFLSQPTVSARIQTLERELDCKLFHRIGKQVQLTDEGRRFLPYAEQMLQTLQTGKRHVRRNHPHTGELRIGSTVAAANYVLPRLLPPMKRRYPQLQFKLQTGTSDELVNRILNKELDVGFVRPVRHPNLRSVQLVEEPIRLYVYEGHPFVGRSDLPLGALGNEPLVVFECGSPDWLRLQRLIESLAQPPVVEIQTDNAETAKKLVLQRAGICFLPELCARREVEEGQLYPVELRETAGLFAQTTLIALPDERNEWIQAFAEANREWPE